MRLIDADEAKKFYKENLILPEKSHEIIVRTMIDAVPTAYSVDKVVEELESELEKGNIAIDFGEFRLFEIVKQGGITDDVCEWKYTKEIMDNAEFKVGCNQNALKRGIVPNNFSYHDFKYCPYCGKKIKVVE